MGAAARQRQTARSWTASVPELLNGQNFNPTAVTEQLSIMVLSYDSFRGRGKEGKSVLQYSCKSQPGES